MAGPSAVRSNKNHKHKHEEPVEVEDPEKAHPWILWLIANRQNLLYGLVLVLALLFAVSRYMNSSRTQAEGDYIMAENHYGSLVSGREAEEAAVELQTIVDRRPELKAKYDGRLAHYFLKQSDFQSAGVYAESALGRQPEDSPYKAYAKTSLLIESGDHSAALTASKELQQTLSGNEQHQHLAAFNAVRIAFLTEAVGSADEAKAAWKDAETLLKLNPEIEAHFATGEVTLADYLKAKY